MEKTPSNRYSQAEEMLEDIKKFQQNPSIRFEYKYFVDDNPTKFVQAINEVRSNNKDNYGDNYSYTNEEVKKKSKATLIAGGIAVAVVLFAVGFLFMTLFNSYKNGSVKDVDVPNFIGMNIQDVQNNSDYNFVWKVESVYDSSKAEGIIIDQNPQSGSKKVKEGSTITLKVNSSGVLVTIPSVKGLTEDVAKAKLNNAGLKYEVLMVVDADTAAGVVNSVDPQEGSKVTANSTVRIYVSKGPAEEKVTVPDVIGKTLSAAKTELVNAGLKVSDEIKSEDSDKAKDTVLSTDPLPGVSVGKDSTVKLMVSSGVKKEKKVSVTVDLPKSKNKDVTITAYIDGVLEVTKTIDTSIKNSYTIEVKGKSEKKTLNVNINGKQYRIYEIDFDKTDNPVKQTASYEFSDNDKSDSAQKSESTNE